MSDSLKVMKERYNKGYLPYPQEIWRDVFVYTESLERQLDKREDDYRQLMNRSDQQIEGLQRQLKEVRELVKAMAHIGIDWGYGKFELEQKHIDKARELYDKQLKEKVGE